MQVYLVKMMEGSCASEMVTYDTDMAFTSFDSAQEYSDYKNDEMAKLNQEYKAVEFKSIELTNRLFTKYIQDTDEEFFSKLVSDKKGESEEEEGAFWDEHYRRLDDFMSDSEAVEKVMTELGFDEDDKKAIRVTMGYKSFPNGLPYYYVSKNPIRVIRTDI